jgi:hypothetical protein
MGVQLSDTALAQHVQALSSIPSTKLKQDPQKTMQQPDTGDSCLQC